MLDDFGRLHRFARGRYCADGTIEEQQMALNIRHAETERPARELAEVAGE